MALEVKKYRARLRLEGAVFLQASRFTDIHMYIFYPRRQLWI